MTSEEDVFFKGDVVDVIRDHVQNLIKFSRAAWDVHYAPALRKLPFILHQYLMMMDMPDEGSSDYGYFYSFAKRIPVSSQKISSEELLRLVPTKDISNELKKLGQAIVALLEKKSGLLSSGEIKSLKAQVEKTTVEVIGKAILKNKHYPKGVEVDAINYPDENRIEVSRYRWNEYFVDRMQRRRLVLHEYLSVMGLDDDKFRITDKTYLSLLRKM